MNRKFKWTPLFLTNFLSVLNDNFLKNLICFVSIAWVVNNNESIVISAATGMLVLPFILFSPWSGKMTKIASKTKIIRYAKFAEIPIMIIALSGFWIENIIVVLVAMFFMGLQSTIISPAKYGLIREIGGEKGISYGTGSIEMLTFLGVLLGTFIAGIVSDIENNRIIIIGIGILAIALLGWYSSCKIKVNEGAPQKSISSSNNPISFLIRSYKKGKFFNGMNYVVLGLSTFWLIGSMIQMNLLIYCPQILKMSNTQTATLMAFVAIAVGSGSWISGLLSGKNSSLAYVPIGGFGLSISISLLFILRPEKVGFIIIILLAAFSAGIFKVPFNIWYQNKIKGRKLGDIIAYNNLVNFIFILISAGLFGLVETYLDTHYVFLLIAILSWIICIVSLLKVPYMSQDFSSLFKKENKLNILLGLAISLYRFLLRRRYKLSIKNEELLTSPSTKLFLPNHSALIDPQIIVAQILKHQIVAPVITESYYKIPGIRNFMSKLNAIPVSDLEKGNRDINVLNSIIEKVNTSLEKGTNVIIYPSGRLATKGLERIQNKQSAFRLVQEAPSDIQIIGIRTKGLWGSMWSRAGKNKNPNLLKNFFYGFLILLANFIFFVPKRKIIIELEDITQEINNEATKDRKSFNLFLENFFNKYGEEKAVRKKYFFFTKPL